MKIFLLKYKIWLLIDIFLTIMLKRKHQCSKSKYWCLFHMCVEVIIDIYELLRCFAALVILQTFGIRSFVPNRYFLMFGGFQP